MEIYLHSFGTRLRARNGVFEVTVPDLTGANNHQVEQIAPHQIVTVIMHSHTSISADAIQLALESDVDIVLCDAVGMPLGRFMSTVPNATVNIQKAQLIASTQPEIALDFVREWLIQKINSQIVLLTKMASYRNDLGKTSIATGACRR